VSGPPPVETGHARIPAWTIAIGAVVVLLAVAMLSITLEGTNPDLVGPPPTGMPSAGGGDAIALIEQAGCQACHGADLTGQGAFPSLHGLAAGPKSDNLQQLGTDHPDDWANLWIDGTGPEVADLERLGMPVFGGPDGQLTTEEIATIVDYLLTLE
jgi:mono/diheme cytochrome c family protein